VPPISLSARTFSSAYDREITGISLHPVNIARSLSVTASAVELGGEGGDGLDTGFGVAGKGARILVTALRLQKDRRHTRFAEVRERRVAELVEGPAAAVSST
jgi:hypothetical protein